MDPDPYNVLGNLPKEALFPVDGWITRMGSREIVIRCRRILSFEEELWCDGRIVVPIPQLDANTNGECECGFKYRVINSIAGLPFMLLPKNQVGRLIVVSVHGEGAVHLE